MQLASLLRGRPSPAARLARCHLLLGKLCALHVHGRAAAVAAATAASPLAAAASKAPTAPRAKTTTPAAAAAAASSARSTHAAPTSRAAAATTRRTCTSYDPACSMFTPPLPAPPLVPRSPMPASVHAIAAVPSAAAIPAATSPTSTRGSSARTSTCFVHQPCVWLGVWGNAGHRERLGLCRRRRVSVPLWGARLDHMDRATLKCGARNLRRRDNRPLPFAQRHSRPCNGRAARRL